MRVLVTGGYGLIGSAVLARLARAGHQLVGAGRSVATARRRFGYVRWIEADVAKLTSASAWQPLLGGIDAVVNCVGVLQDGAHDDVRRVHVEGTCALFDACLQSGVRRVVHVSALGAAADGPTAFTRTKAAADAHLAGLDLDWVILRPGLVLAPVAYGGTAMLRALAAVPLLTPAIDADSRIQVVGVDEVAETVALCLGSGAPARVRFDLAQPRVYSFGEIVVAMRCTLGFPQRPLLKLPHVVGTAIARVADTLGWLGWRSPARSTALAQLTNGVVGDPSGWMAATGIAPKTLDNILAAVPSGVQERWFARLYLIKPLAIFALALFWIATGIVALGPGRAAATAHLAAAGFAPPFAEFLRVAGSIFDIVLGAMLLIRRLARPALITMLAATPLYLLVGTATAPQLWIDPLGPFLKIIPMLVATLLTLAILDER